MEDATDPVPVGPFFARHEQREALPARDLDLLARPLNGTAGPDQEVLPLSGVYALAVAHRASGVCIFRSFGENCL